MRLGDVLRDFDRFHRVGGAALLLLFLVGARPAAAEAVFAPGADPALDAHMRANTRMFYAFMAKPFGIGITASYVDAAALDAMRAFLDQDASDDVEAVTGHHPYELIGGYEGPAGIGLRGGGAAIGTAFRYMALKAEGAPDSDLAVAELAAARADVVRALEYLHVVHAITGVSWGMSRGAMLTRSPDPDDPPFPHGTPELLPLFDENGEPFPADIYNGWARADNSGGELPEGLWYWVDDVSKDQLVGWVAAMATLYDAAKDDPDIDQAIVTQLEEDAREVGAGLRVEFPFTAINGQTYGYDLTILDADGTPTEHADLHPLAIEDLYLPPDAQRGYNVFNLVMGLGIVKGLYHVSGDPEAEAFLYEELLRNRGWLDWVPPAATFGLDYTYNGSGTNHSNVNMIAIALFLNVWFERDPDVLARFRTYVEERWWDVDGVAESARHLKQPYFHALYEAMTTTGTDPARTAEAAALLKAFTLDPYVNEERVNCDADELAAGTCLAIDGETELTIAALSSWGDDPVATEPLDPSIRPPSNFDARSNPFTVNGGGGKGLNPGGDLHAAYWLLRYLPVRAPGETVGSPNARDHVPVVVVPPPADETVAEPVPDVVDAAHQDAAPDVAGPAPDAARDGWGETVGVDAPSDVDPLTDTGAPSPDGRGDDTSGSGSASGGGCTASSSATPGTAAFLMWLLMVVAALRLMGPDPRTSGRRSAVRR